MPNRVSHFEIHAENPERCAEFYAKAFGWDIKEWKGGQMEYWIVMTGGDTEPGGINGGIIRRKGPAPAEGQSVSAYVCTIVVSSYDEYAAKIETAGGRNVVPKAALLGMAWQGYFKDSEGNIFGLHQTDKDAK